MDTDNAIFSDLISRYNRPGPRYTSYPPAVHFSEKVSRERLLAEIGSGQGPLSLYFHLPFCESLCWFCGCNTITTRNHGQADGYLDLLERELALTAEHLGAGADGLCERPVVQLHFGGGTPNFLSPEQILRLGGMIARHFRFAPDAERGVELDPRRLSAAQVEAFAAIGMNRASFGVQDCEPKVQEAIHRVQSRRHNEQAMQWLRASGFESVNVDLIYGLPHQSPESFTRTLEEVLRLDPDRFAVFSYAHVPWLRPAQKNLEKGGALPGPQQKVELLSLVLRRLSAAGYRAIGMDHFARPQDELCRAQEQGTLQRNFQGYSTRADCEIVAFGVSSISQTPRSYRQNHKDLREYRAALEAGVLPLERGYLLSDEDVLRRTTIMQLMCNLELDYAAMSARLGVDFADHFAGALAALRPFADDALVTLEPDRLRVTPLGRWFIRNIAMCFDAYLSAPASGASVPQPALSQGGANVSPAVSTPAPASPEAPQEHCNCVQSDGTREQDGTGTREQNGGSKGTRERKTDVPPRRYSQTL